MRLDSGRSHRCQGGRLVTRTFCVRFLRYKCGAQKLHASLTFPKDRCYLTRREEQPSSFTDSVGELVQGQELLPQATLATNEIRRGKETEAKLSAHHLHHRSTPCKVEARPCLRLPVL
ncbi:hypothetical protein I79_015232 [Cricetulus griseus]|uniref:Uncharacterized protein n=1 Tax=Cricetulus griseus TaxID=10029 RepID=G3HW78_CRIGR|nr:hypothetical protein I79_015232 [Cricetulus griseus]